MVREFLERLRTTSREGRRRDRVSIILPFLIITVGLGVLAWRSHSLSVKMEQGANTLAVQYAGYAAEITARRVDAAVRAELTRASEEWQRIERSRSGEPDAKLMRDWMTRFGWIVSALYVPDWDPASSIYFSEMDTQQSTSVLSREFFTSSGMVRFQYEPSRLIDAVRSSVKQQPLVRTANLPDTLPVQRQADVSVVVKPLTNGSVRTPQGFQSIVQLAPPVSDFSIRAVVRTAYVGSGWENQRIMSLGLSLVALVLTGLGVALGWRGMRKESETMKLRGALIANVSHELRTPLAMIRLGAETLKRGAKLKDHERQEIEDQILREVLLLSHLVENVLDVARIQNRSSKALAFTPVHPRDLVGNLLHTYESWIRSKGFEVRARIDESVGEQMWDRDSVSRALLNLIDNAIKYSGDEDDKVIEVALRQNPEFVVLEVTDHGLGIDAKDAARIFDPYYRARFSDTITRRGAGLGLTLVQQILESHGGKVELDSTPGEGSTFRLLFPRDLEGEPALAGTVGRPREAF